MVAALAQVGVQSARHPTDQCDPIALVRRTARSLAAWPYFPREGGLRPLARKGGVPSLPLPRRGGEGPHFGARFDIRCSLLGLRELSRGAGSPMNLRHLATQFIFRGVGRKAYTLVLPSPRQGSIFAVPVHHHNSTTYGLGRVQRLCSGRLHNHHGGR